MKKGKVNAANTPAARARKLRYHHRIQRTLQSVASNHRQLWTVKEIETALDRSRSAREIAAEIGRTAKGVEKIRANDMAAKSIRKFNMKTEIKKLHLHVKSEYFGQIQRGAKTEEYRLHNAYWIRRLVHMPSGVKREFAGVVVHNAYKPGADNRLEFPWNGWSLAGIRHPHFGEDEVTVFAIRLRPESF